jgi:plasmid stabilization system protein ParE
MKEYKIKILDSVFDDIDSLADFIVSVSLPEHAVRYVRELGAEIMTLRYLADIIPQSRYRTVLRYHPHAKQLRTRNRRFNIIFHTEEDTVIVDKIIASKMITN